MTKQQKKALDVLFETSREKSEGDPMAGLILGMSAAVAYGKLKDILFERNTENEREEA